MVFAGLLLWYLGRWVGGKETAGLPPPRWMDRSARGKTPLNLQVLLISLSCLFSPARQQHKTLVLLFWPGPDPRPWATYWVRNLGSGALGQVLRVV